ncbi:Protein brunelleschi [Frankliniella fusca]|uniref:Protein brunelleschi n=1 Tax=Frankliniella fusca TaxID=407009 RepID=A0AAE1HFN7_9NEOP|nr:Protein brunelleschi [Frankliniella fusca]
MFEAVWKTFLLFLWLAELGIDITSIPMRSSVSYILSSPAPDTRMSHPDYDQIAQDHASILILVHHQEGLLKPKSFSKVWDKIRRVNHTKVNDSAGITRQVYVRYVKDYPVESNDWGEFQTHRRLLGLITVGQYESQTDLNEICRFHESLKVRYTTTLYDSRCILFGKENEDLKTPSNFKSLPLWYSDVESCTDLESQVSELLNSLFWVLESKRQLLADATLQQDNARQFNGSQFFTQVVKECCMKCDPF